MSQEHTNLCGIWISGIRLKKQRVDLTSRAISMANPTTSSSSSVAASPTEEKMDRLPAELNVTKTQEPNSRVRLQVEVPAVVCEDCYERVISEFTKQASGHLKTVASLLNVAEKARRYIPREFKLAEAFGLP
ncbi:uncharacterized protein LOC107487330 isoform X2 [Arachis duranensis]|uniref:Uncharacterized protein LOC107487330 isoform X2 n=1 Tax=Arachis duranensis TaxID=130453 RepID=A0A9C6WQR3_ARADU|nr:uncharacterized protein LOC107487330 isoform X2 [Arachis duranensis]